MSEWTKEEPYGTWWLSIAPEEDIQPHRRHSGGEKVSVSISSTPHGQPNIAVTMEQPTGIDWTMTGLPVCSGKWVDPDPADPFADSKHSSSRDNDLS